MHFFLHQNSPDFLPFYYFWAFFAGEVKNRYVLWSKLSLAKKEEVCVTSVENTISVEVFLFLEKEPNQFKTS